MLNNQYEIIDKFNALVKPSFSIEAYNARKDKILNSSDSSVLIRGKFGKIYKAFCEWIGVTPIDILVWGEQDYLILNREFEVKYQGEDKKTLNKYMSKFINMQKVLMRMLDAEKMPSLDFALNLVKEKFIGKRHNAYADAENTARLFAKLHRQKRFEFNANYIADEINPPAYVPEYEKATIAELASIDFTPTESEEVIAKTKKTIEYGANKKDASMLSITSFLTPGIKGEHKFVETIHKIIDRKNNHTPSCSSGDYCEFNIPKNIYPSFRQYLYTEFPYSENSCEDNLDKDLKYKKDLCNYYIKIVNTDFARKPIDEVTLSDIKAFCKRIVKCYSSEHATATLRLLQEMVSKAIKDGYFNSDISSTIEHYIENIKHKEPFMDALVRLFTSDWDNVEYKAIAETIMLTGYTIQDFNMMKQTEAKALAIALENDNWLSNYHKGFSPFIKEYLDKHIDPSATYAFGDTGGNFLNQYKIDDYIEDLRRKLHVKYTINIAYLMNLGVSHANPLMASMFNEKC